MPSACDCRILAKDIHQIERMVRQYDVMDFAFVLATIFHEYNVEDGNKAAGNVVQALNMLGFNMLLDGLRRK